MFKGSGCKVKALTIDVGNTILTNYPSMEGACAVIIKQMTGVDVCSEKLSLGVGKALSFYESEYKKDDTFWSCERRISSLWMNMYEFILEETGIGKGEIDTCDIYKEFGNSKWWQIYPDVVPALKKIRNAGIRIGVISNWDIRLSEILMSLDLEKVLDFIVSSAVIAKTKPDPAIFEAAAKRSGALPSETVHVGDNYYADVMGARTIGMHPVLIDRSRTIEPGEMDCPVIYDFHELAEMMIENTM